MSADALEAAVSQVAQQHAELVEKARQAFAEFDAGVDEWIASRRQGWERLAVLRLEHSTGKTIDQLLEEARS